MEAVESIDYMHDVEPAPGRLALVQRFVNTVDFEHGREQLHSPARLQALLLELGLLDAGVRVTEADLERALEIREGLRGLALANNEGVDDSVLEAELDPTLDAYAAERLAKVPGVSLRFTAPFFKEFALKLPKAPDRVIPRLARQGFLAGVPLKTFDRALADCLLVAVTEKRTKAEIDAFAAALEKAVA